MLKEPIESILKDEQIKRFIELNIEIIRQMAYAEHGHINCGYKDCKFQINRKSLNLEG